MSDELPASVKILWYFKDMAEVSKDRILDSFRDRDRTLGVLSTLVDKGVLGKKEDTYKQGPNFEPTQTKMQEVHNQVSDLDIERETKEWVMRGSLIEVLYIPDRQFLENLYIFMRGIHLPLKPLTFVHKVIPFEKKEVEEFLKRENKRKLIEISKVLNRDISPSQEYFRYPYYVYRDITAQKSFSPREKERVKKSWKGSKIYEEYFVYGKYTKTVMDKARGYLSSRNDIADKIVDRLYAELYGSGRPPFWGDWYALHS